MAKEERFEEKLNELEKMVSELESGDVILLASGGHGFVCLEETEMYEVKQGPYAGEMDKTRFEAVSEESLKIVDEGSSNEW